MVCHRSNANALAHALYQADVEFWETVVERTKGNPYAEPPMLRSWEPIRSNGVAVPVTKSGPLFSEVLPSFLDYMVSYEEWRGQTLAQNKTSYAMFKECCGDLPVTAYERRHLAAFHDLLRALPKLYSKSAAWRGLSLGEIAARTKEGERERLSMTTVKRHFAALGRLFAYLKQRGEYQGENPAYGFEFPDKRRDREKRGMWQGKPLRKLFAFRCGPAVSRKADVREPGNSSSRTTSTGCLCSVSITAIVLKNSRSSTALTCAKRTAFGFSTSMTRAPSG